MQEYGKTIVTNDGRQMLTEVDGSKGKIAYTRAALYTQNINAMSEVDRTKLTALTGELISTELIVKEVKDTTVTVAASFNNAKVSKDTKFNSIGWFAKTSVSDTEKLMATTPSLQEQTLVAGNKGATTTSLDIDCLFGISHDTTVVVQTSPVGMVNGEQLIAEINKAKDEINKKLPSIAEQAKNDANNDVNSLKALTNSNNTISNQQIDADALSTAGINKFTGCQLTSVGFNFGTDTQDGWIFNIPNQDGSPSYQQIIYISGKGIYYRSIANAKNVTEVFEKLETARDVASLAVLSQDGVLKTFVKTTINPDQIVDTGIYRISNCALAIQATTNKLNSRYWGWLINLNYENQPVSNAVYQILIVGEQLYFRTISVKTSKYPAFDSFAYASDVVGKVTQISVNNRPAVTADENGLAALTVPDPDLTPYATNADLNKVSTRVTALETKELVHQSADLATGIAYSKAHPNVLVATP